ncbi:hypothetical protein ACI3L1_15925 [Deinococcus sp. SM5_A1]|uniref:P-type ATPase n=1 Tax=Deinococcus sp. SM5_A1 TaxID=3379094 RepID=UPI00385990C9
MTARDAQAAAGAFAGLPWPYRVCPLACSGGRPQGRGIGQPETWAAYSSLAKALIMAPVSASPWTVALPVSRPTCTLRMVAVFVSVVLAIAAVTFAVWIFIGGEGALANALVHTVAVLVIACPCALGLTTPVGILVGSGRRRWGCCSAAAQHWKVWKPRRWWPRTRLER